MFLAHKDESFKVFSIFCKHVQNEKEQGILHIFSYLRIPQQNGIVERKNRSFQEMARTLLNDFNSPKYFWVEVINIVCYLQNKIYIRSILKRIAYEFVKGIQPNISYFHPFGCECFILNTKDNLGKFDSKLDKRTFLGYSTTSKAYRVYNSRTLKVELFIHVKFNDCKPDKELSKLNDLFKFKSRRFEDIIQRTRFG
ncbi:hypothetical protein CR513_28173, partial [Mucuna pruriens]